MATTSGPSPDLTVPKATDRGPGPKRGRALVLSHWLPVALYIVLIFSMSSIQSLKVPGPFPFMDKVAHLMEYSLFGLLVGRAIRFTMSGSSRLRMSLAAIAFGAFIGMTDELYQRFVPGRECDFFDWLTDVTAVTLAVVITQVVTARPLYRGRRTDETR